MKREILVSLILVACMISLPVAGVSAETCGGQGVSQAGTQGIAEQALAKETRIKCFATVKYPLPGRGGTQTVYIRVTDGARRGLAGASVRVLVRQRDGARWLYAPATDAGGHSLCSFPLGESPTGYTVLVEVIAQWRGSRARAYTSYTPCW